MKAAWAASLLLLCSLYTARKCAPINESGPNLMADMLTQLKVPHLFQATKFALYLEGIRTYEATPPGGLSPIVGLEYGIDAPSAKEHFQWLSQRLLAQPASDDAPYYHECFAGVAKSYILYIPQRAIIPSSELRKNLHIRYYFKLLTKVRDLYKAHAEKQVTAFFSSIDNVVWVEKRNARRVFEPHFAPSTPLCRTGSECAIFGGWIPQKAREKFSRQLPGPNSVYIQVKAVKLFWLLSFSEHAKNYWSYYNSENPNFFSKRLSFYDDMMESMNIFISNAYERKATTDLDKISDGIMVPYKVYSMSKEELDREYSLDFVHIRPFYSWN